MTLVMAYVILIAATIAACATAAEVLLRRSRLSLRWTWVIAIVATVASTAFAVFAPVPTGPSEVTPVSARISMNSAVVVAPGVVPALPNPPAIGLLARGDTLLPIAWLSASVMLLLAIGFGQRRLANERGAAREIVLQGHPVLLTDNLGPAVAGIRRPEVFIPRWVLALDDSSQRLLLAHELEHARHRDTALLLGSATCAALMPWNPVVWYIARRLRLAVEQDCDARVLKTHPGVRRYADLLLMAAGRHGLPERLLAAHFGEHSSDLVKRIEAMTTSGSWRRTLGAALVASAFVALACNTSRPTPVAPLAGDSATAQVTKVQRETETTNAKEAAISLERELVPNLLVQTSDGREVLRFVAETACSGKSAHADVDYFDILSRETSPPGLLGNPGCAVHVITLKPGREKVYRVVGNRMQRIKPAPDINCTLWEDGTAACSPPPAWRRSTIIVLASDGTELARKAPGVSLKDFNLAGAKVRSIDVMDTVCAPVACSFITVTLKPGSSLQKFPERAASFEEALKRERALEITGDTLTSKVEAGELVATRLVIGDREVNAQGHADRPSEVRIWLRNQGSPREMPNIIVRSSDGAELRRFVADTARTYTTSPIEEIRTDDIGAIEVYKGSACPVTANIPCPLIIISLKPGRDASYRKR